MNEHGITFTTRFGYTDDTELSPARLDQLRAQGWPEEAIRPNNTLDLEVAKRHGWMVTKGGMLLGPPPDNP